MEALTDDPRGPAAWVAIGPDEAVMGCPPSPPQAGGAVVIAGTHTTGGELVDPAWVLERASRSTPRWSDAVAPFAALVLDRGRGVMAVTDPVGLGPVVHTQGDGWAALSTSAIRLGAAVARGLDEHALLDLALTGTFVGSATAIQGVAKLTAGETVELHAGQRTVRRYDAPLPPGVPGAAGGARVVQEAVTAAVAGRDHIVIELSGGLDSRLLLAALPASQRAQLEAVTIGTESSPDVDIARRLAARLGISHRTIDLGGLLQLEASTLHEMAAASAVAHDCGANPLAHLVLDHADALIGSAPRLSGQNGELARGYFYGGQPPWPRASRPLIRALQRWRLTTNDAVAPGLFEPGAIEATEERLTSELVAAFARFPAPWLTATDHLYLRHRMQRWVGAAYWSACQQRPILAPFFDPRFLGWALDARPSDKRGSKLASQVLGRLSPALAEVPLDNGLVPAELAAASWRTRLDLVIRSSHKLTAKVAQRRSARTRPPVAVAEIAATVREHWRRSGTTLEAVAALPFISAPEVAAIVAGRHEPDPATTGYLVALEALVGDRR